MLYGVTVVDDLGVSCVSEWGIVFSGPKSSVGRFVDSCRAQLDGVLNLVKEFFMCGAVACGDVG